MPARKNRPGKHGVVPQGAPQPRTKQQLMDAQIERALVDKLIKCERESPMHDHYVSWLDMRAAKQLVKHGYLREGGRATGCFVVTETFRENFMR